jgi:hypothetical protein
MKLLSKMADERYASLAGLIHDLKRCGNSFRKTVMFGSLKSAQKISQANYKSPKPYKEERLISNT